VIAVTVTTRLHRAHHASEPEAAKIDRAPIHHDSFLNDPRRSNRLKHPRTKPRASCPFPGSESGLPRIVQPELDCLAVGSPELGDPRPESLPPESETAGAPPTETSGGSKSDAPQANSRLQSVSQRLAQTAASLSSGHCRGPSTRFSSSSGVSSEMSVKFGSSVKATSNPASNCRRQTYSAPNGIDLIYITSDGAPNGIQFS
jgi:hypothetical protein